MCHNSLPTSLNPWCVYPGLELLNRVGRKLSKPHRRDLILLFVSSQHIRLEKLLRSKGFRVVVLVEADQVVAFSLSNRSDIAATIIDEMSAPEEEGWSLARSLKAVCPNIPVMLLVSSRATERRSWPEGVDCVVGDSEPREIVDALRGIQTEARQAG